MSSTAVHGMANSLSVNEYDLLNFFNAAPAQSDEGLPWEYSDSAYEAGDSHLRVCFAIAPAVKDITIRLTIAGAFVSEFSALGVQDVRHRHAKGREQLEVVVTPRDSVWRSLRPQIFIWQHVAGDSS